MTRETISIALLLMYESCLSKDAPGAAAAAAFPAPPAGCRRARGAQPSAWAPYLRLLPANFTAPFFWSPEQLRELQGSQVPPARRQRAGVPQTAPLRAPHPSPSFIPARRQS